MTEPVYLKNYKPYPFRFPAVSLDFDLNRENTIVSSHIQFERRSDSSDQAAMELNGQNLSLLEIRVNDRILKSNEYRVTSALLTITGLPEKGTLEIRNSLNPQDNTELMGLYYRDNLFCTQNEAEGFRRITWYPDRPDVLAPFTVTIRGDKKDCPLLLSNGNPVDRGELPEGRHYVKWYDPFPKPSYLFALVAGDLEEVSDHHITQSKKRVDLKIYVNHGDSPRTSHAMACLKKAMRWDEEVYGLEYDLDLFMIVAVDSFNMGAMENKGLNIYNSSLVLADKETCTDQELHMIDRVVAHEYFHNWTGDRVTCRDWFQLTLKEGLTVYRDEEYISDMTTRAGVRIDTAGNLRKGQFSEDAGPLAHPVRPASYLAIDNFYTSTVYQKGKEVIRMVETLIGKESFKKGLNLYLEKNDGKAARVEDFISAMEEVSQQDLTQFMRWYSQAGTPEVIIKDEYDSAAEKYTLHIKQRCRPTAENRDKQPFVIPMKWGLIFPSDDSFVESNAEKDLIVLTQKEHTFTYTGVKSKPVPSFFRNFSAPVNYEYNYTQEDLLLLMTHDSDGFNSYDAGQRLAEQILTGKQQAGDKVFNAYSRFLNINETDSALCAKNLTLPSADYLAGRQSGYPIVDIHKRRVALIKEIALHHEALLKETYLRLKEKPYSDKPEETGRRRLKNVCLSYLSELGKEYRELVYSQYKESDNMTDTLAALELLVNIKDDISKEALNDFYQKWQKNTLVLNKWFSLQARSLTEDVIEVVQTLERHPRFDKFMPNRVRALYGAFADNALSFNHHSGQGYHFIADRVMAMDRINPLVAARLVKNFQVYNLLDRERKDKMESEMNRIKESKGLSPNVFDVIQRIMEG